MGFSGELEKKIKILFENNEELRDKLLAGDADSIRQIGSLSQKGLDPEKLVKARESGDNNALEELYKEAKLLCELKKLYRELCLEYGRATRNKNSLEK